MQEITNRKLFEISLRNYFSTYHISPPLLFPSLYASLLLSFALRLTIILNPSLKNIFFTLNDYKVSTSTIVLS